MMQPQMIASLPIWLAGLLMLGCAISGAVTVELLVRRVVSPELRTSHMTVASAMFSVVGTTYAVLLAFVAMLAWDGFNKAQSVTDTEASLVLNVYTLVDGLSGPEMGRMRSDIGAYAAAVVHVEWPAQARGGIVQEDQPSLVDLTRIALRLRPSSIADGDLHTLLLNDLAQLSSVRRERLLILRTPIPLIVWFVLLAGGGISIAFASFLGARSLLMQLAMTSVLAVSGALVLLLIVALSNPFRGGSGISAEPFEHALVRMSSDLAMGTPAAPLR